MVTGRLYKQQPLQTQAPSPSSRASVSCEVFQNTIENSPFLEAEFSDPVITGIHWRREEKQVEVCASSVCK